MTEDQTAAKTITAGQVGWGFGIAMICHLLLFLLFPLIALVDAMGMKSGDALFIAFFNPGATQLFYEIPLLLFFNKRGERGKFRGVLIAMGLTILLNGLCWVALATNKFRIGG